VIRDDTRRQRQAQLCKSRSEADQRVGKPGVHIGARSSTNDDLCRDSWERETGVEKRLAEPPPDGRRATAEYLAYQRADLIVEGAWRVAGVRAG
jgi:hypothetical protein